MIPPSRAESPSAPISVAKGTFGALLITTFGGYLSPTHINRLFYSFLCLKGGVQGDSTYGATLLNATQWHLGTLVPLREGS